MELRDRRVWDLRDLLGFAGEPPTSAGDGSSPDDTWYMRPQLPVHPRLVGKSHHFGTERDGALPSVCGLLMYFKKYFLKKDFLKVLFLF